MGLGKSPGYLPFTNKKQKSSRPFHEATFTIQLQVPSQWGPLLNCHYERDLPKGTEWESYTFSIIARASTSLIVAFMMDFSGITIRSTYNSYGWSQKPTPPLKGCIKLSKWWDKLPCQLVSRIHEPLVLVPFYDFYDYYFLLGEQWLLLTSTSMGAKTLVRCVIPCIRHKGFRGSIQKNLYRIPQKIQQKNMEHGNGSFF